MWVYVCIHVHGKRWIGYIILSLERQEGQTANCESYMHNIVHALLRYGMQIIKSYIIIIIFGTAILVDELTSGYYF